MSQNVAGIDFGTANVRVGLAANLIGSGNQLPKMSGFGSAESHGLQQGYVLEKEEAAQSLKKAITMAEKSAKSPIREAWLSVGGAGLAGLTASAEIMISKADLEVTELDTEKLEVLCEENLQQNFSLNRRIIHRIPLQYKLDGKPVLGSPLGLKGVKLELKTLFIGYPEKYLNDLVETVEKTGVEVGDVLAGPLSASLVLLSKQQKKAGCALVNIGAETVSIVAYENGLPVSLEVFPVGSNRITNDIALGLRISLEEAEHIKVGGLTAANYPRKRLEEIIEARLSDIFDMIDGHLRKIGRSGLLPAGLIFHGGGSQISGLEELAKNYLRLPVKLAAIQTGENAERATVKDASWATVYGLCLYGLTADRGQTGGSFSGLVRRTGRLVKKLFKQFLP